MITPDYWIKNLELSPHPEGGYYKEIYTSGIVLKNEILPQVYDGDRKLTTSIYYLLRSGEISYFHQLKSDEIWYFHCGSSLKISSISRYGELSTEMLGIDAKKGEKPQIIIPAGTIFGAEVVRENSYTLLSCMVSPGFELNDFKLFTRKELLERYTQYSDIINKLSR